MQGRGTAKKVWWGVLALSLVLGLLVPARYMWWARHLGVVTQVLIAPVSGPVTQLVRWVSPAGVGPNAPSAQASRELQELHTTNHALVQENLRLRAQLAQMRVIVQNNTTTVDQLPTSVVGVSSDLSSQSIVLRAGSRDHVRVGDVVTADFVQLLGRVASVSSRTCTVLPITAKNATDMEAVVLLGPASTLRCRLAPAGEGLLSGDIEDRRDIATGESIVPKVGDEVRLNDPTRWPASSQMLIVGKVESVEASPKQPLRKVVVVRPTVPDLTRLAEAVVRITSSEGDDTRTSLASPQGGGE